MRNQIEGVTMVLDAAALMYLFSSRILTHLKTAKQAMLHSTEEPI